MTGAPGRLHQPAVSQPVYELALYRLDQDGGAAIPGPFDAALYSRYKYGSAAAADSFARALGQAFLDRYRRLAHQPRFHD